MTTKEQLHRLVEELAERDQAVAAFVLEHLRSEGRSGPPHSEHLSGDARDRLTRLVAELLPDDSASSRDDADPVLRAFMEAPEDDEPLTLEELEAIEEGAAEVARGEAVPWSQYLESRQRTAGHGARVADD